MNPELITSYPATVTISAESVHAMSLPEYPDSQNGGSALVQTLHKGNTVTVSGWVAVQQDAVQLNWLDLSSVVPAGYQIWWVANGFYVQTSATAEQPDPSVGQLTPPNGNWNALIANAAAQGSLGAVIPNAISSAGSTISSAGTNIQNFFKTLFSDATSVVILVVVILIIYMFVKSGVMKDI